MSPNQPIQTTATTVWLGDDGIVRVRADREISTGASVNETLEAVRSLIGDSRHPVLFDATAWRGGDPGAWQVVAARLDTHFSAAAVLIDPDNPPALGAFPDMLDRLMIPFRVFDSASAAVSFLTDAAD